MSKLLLYALKDDILSIVFIGLIFIITLQSLTTETSITISDANFIQLATAQTPSTNNSLINKDTDNQNKSEDIIEASGHFANNQIKDGIVTWIQGGYWNLQISNITNNDDDDNNDNQTSNNNYKANFLANFTMIKPDGSLSHNHVINNFSSNNVFLTDNDIVVTGIANIRSDNGLEYNQVPLIVHLMGKKVLGLTIDVSKTEEHFASSNEMFGTLIIGVGIDSSNTTKTMMNPDDAMTNETADKTPMAMMQH